MERAAGCAAVAVLMSVAFLGACGGDDSDRDVGVPNPASVFCEDHGGDVEIQRDPAGNETGICVLPDGTRVEEWEYYRDNSPSPTTEPVSPTT